MSALEKRLARCERAAADQLACGLAVLVDALEAMPVEELDREITALCQDPGAVAERHGLPSAVGREVAKMIRHLETLSDAELFELAGPQEEMDAISRRNLQIVIESFSQEPDHRATQQEETAH